MRTLEEQVNAPKDFGVSVIGVPEGSPVDLDLRLEAVHEGILVTGTATATVEGECSRCLDAIAFRHEVPVQELFYYSAPAERDEEEELYTVEDDSIDLEPLLRDSLVTSLPFQPVCKEDCQGLCSECGIKLEEDPGHQHEILDPRWAALADLAGPASSEEDSDTEDHTKSTTEKS